MSEWQVINGDSLDVLKQLPEGCIDALVTDPPAGIGFMGKEWDEFGRVTKVKEGDIDPSKNNKGLLPHYGRGGTSEDRLKYKARARKEFVAFMETVARECLRVMKPGAHGVVWALPRTSHWTATALEQAGFEVRDVITHHFGTGFPKSLNVSKAIDEAAGATREVVAIGSDGAHRQPRAMAPGGEARSAVQTTSEPVTEAARQWDGWGTALKPASEHWILVRKPLSGTVAANVQEHGTGALNIDATRIEAPDAPDVPAISPNANARYVGTLNGGKVSEPEPRAVSASKEGRWPANLVLSHSEWCEPLDASGAVVEVDEYGDASAAIASFRCLPGCPVALLDAQSGPSTSTKGKPRSGPKGDGYRMTATGAEYSDKGAASRFFYVSKPSTKEREDGLSHLPKKSGGEIVDRAEDSAGINNPRAGAGRTAKGRANFHPTVKSIGLMSWLVRLISPPGGVVLDPFCGSGTTGVAAVLGGWSFLGIEKDPEYMPIAEARIAHANGEAPAIAEAAIVALTSPALVPDAIIPPGATLCMACHEVQFDTPSGISCANGHGGALSTSVESLTAA